MMMMKLKKNLQGADGFCENFAITGWTYFASILIAGRNFAEIMKQQESEDQFH
jgi:hypothetical protein